VSPHGGVPRTARPTGTIPPATRIDGGRALDTLPYRREAGPWPRERVTESVLPTAHGRFRALAFQEADGTTHLALVLGEVARAGVVPVRVHSECLTGDVFGSLRCDCGAQLDLAMQRIAAAGRGVVVYVRGHEGRGIGLFDKLRAYRLQDEGMDTLDANVALNLPIDARRYDAAAAILEFLQVDGAQLMTNNPEKVRALREAGLTVAEVQALVVPVQAESAAYLRAKQERLNHRFGPNQG
jgi:3,4-dihydroxy 2-butanone 4-phosphate synthase/GTP cyclohydrolase II